MTVQPPPDTLCSICFSDFQDSPFIYVTGKNHPKPCFFHNACLEQWRVSSPVEDELPGAADFYPNHAICPNDRCRYTHINQKWLLLHDDPALDAIVALFCRLISCIRCRKTP